MRPLATIQTNGRGPTTTSSMHPTLIHPFLSTLDYFPDRAIESSHVENRLPPVTLTTLRPVHEEVAT